MPPDEPIFDPTNLCSEVPGYQFEAILGRGGFGYAIRARRLSDGLPVAIKIGDPDRSETVDRLLVEEAALRSIGPPWVPALYDSGMLDNHTPYLTMEFVPWETLAQRLAQLPGPMDASEFFQRAPAIVDAVAAIHRAHFIHRDFKPESILSTQSDAKICGLSLARSIDDPTLPPPIKIERSIGTADYLSPEHCRGDPVQDPRSDIYALGIILYEMLTGRPPFFGRFDDVCRAHLDQRPPRPSLMADVSPGVEELLLRCLAKSPDQRFRTAEELQRALRDAGFDAATSLVPGLSPPSNSSIASEPDRLEAVLLTETRADLRGVELVLKSFGGSIATFHADRIAAVFLAGTEGAAIERAFQAARELSDKNLAERSLIDLAPVQCWQAPDQSLRFFSPLFEREDSFPLPSDPPGPLLTETVLPALSGHRFEPVPSRERLFTAKPATSQRGEASRDPARLVGRHDTLTKLVSLAQESVENQMPACAAVLGEASSGKTVLCGELRERLAASSGARVVELRAQESIEGERERTLPDLLRAILDLRIAGTETPREGYELLCREIGPPLADASWPALGLALGWIPIDDPELGVFACPAGSLRARTIRTVGELLRARAGSQPLCVLVDRAELADSLTLDVLEYAALSEAKASIWICLFARPSLRLARPGWGERAARNEWLELPPPPQEETIEWLAIRQLETLPSDLLSHAQLLALVGPRFRLRDLEGILHGLEQQGYAEVFPLDARAGIDRLLEADLLVRDGEEFRFPHENITEQLSRLVPETIRQAVHLIAFQHYQASGEANLAPRSAMHAAAAGLSAAAAPLYLDLARGAQQRQAYLEAESLYAQALPLLRPADAEQRLSCLRGRGTMRSRLGRHRDAISDFAQACKVAAQLGDLACEIDLLLDQAAALDWIGDEIHSQQQVQTAIHRANSSRLRLPLIESKLLLATARSKFRFGEAAAASVILRVAVEKAQALGESGYETLLASLLLQAVVSAYLERTEEAEQAFARSLEIAEQQGDPFQVCAALSNRLMVWTVRKDAANAVRDQRTCVAIARELGMVAQELTAEGKIAEILYQAGDLESARPHVWRAVELEARYPEIGPWPVQLLLQARFWAYQDCPEEARACLEQIQSRLPDRPAEAGGVLVQPKEQVLLAMVDLATRSATKAEWDQLIQATERHPTGQELIEVLEMRGLCAIRAGYHDDARQFLEEALLAAQRFPSFMEPRVRRAIWQVP